MRHWQPPLPLALVISPAMANTLETMRLRAAFPYFYPTPTAIFRPAGRTDAQGTAPATVLADQDLSVTIPAYVANANVIAHRVPTTSEIFPADHQVEALQRLIDQETFFRTRYLTQDSFDILTAYACDYVVVPAAATWTSRCGSSPSGSTWLEDDQSYSLYARKELPRDAAAHQM